MAGSPPCLGGGAGRTTTRARRKVRVLLGARAGIDLAMAVGLLLVSAGQCVPRTSRGGWEWVSKCVCACE